MHRCRANTEPIRVDRWFRARGALSVLTFNRACELGELLPLFVHVPVPMFFRECAFGAQVWCCTAHGVTVHSLRTDSRENTALVTPLQGACKQPCGP